MNTVTISIVILGSIGFMFSLLLAVLSKKLHVAQDPKIEQINETLPGINCGACGFSGCGAYTRAVVKENKLFNGCLPGGEEVNGKIAAILGLDGAKQAKKTVTAVCLCGADASEKVFSSQYEGPLTCRLANFYGGGIDCAWGCLGLGDCIKVCPVNAISLNNKKITIDTGKCIACGKCIKACPRKVLKLTPVKEETGLFYVACSNKDKAAAVKKVCRRGCTGCTLCAKVPDSPYSIKDNLSRVDFQKITKKGPLEAGQKKCPSKCIDNA